MIQTIYIDKMSRNTFQMKYFFRKKTFIQRIIFHLSSQLNRKIFFISSDRQSNYFSNILAK